MSNLVNELQVSAEEDDVLTVLRKTKRLASKLERQDISDWLLCEQNGYFDNLEFPIPDYRLVPSVLAVNATGYVPMGMNMAMTGAMDLPNFTLGEMKFRHAISNVLSAIEDMNKTGQSIHIPIDDSSLTENLRRMVSPEFSRQISFMMKLSDFHIRAIPERIKDKVLDWALALERAGVTGEGMSFSAREKEIAHNVTFNIINSRVGQLNNQGTNLRGKT